MASEDTGDSGTAPTEAEESPASAEPAAAEIAEPTTAEVAAQKSAATERPAAGDEDAPVRKEPALRGRFASAFSLGFSLSTVGFLAKASLVLAVLTTIGAIVVALLLAQGDAPPLAAVPGLTASALAWGGGFTFAVAAAARAFDRDNTDGVRFLARTRGVPVGTYAIGRVFGLAVVLMLIVGIGSVVTGGVCAGLAHGGRAAIGRSTLASAAYAIAFGALMAPLAAATLGARARGRGYIILLSLLIVPEMLQDSLDTIPERWRGLFGIPSVMNALRDSLTPAHFDAPLAAAAAIVIVVTAIVALFFAIEQAFSAARVTESR